MKSVSGPLGSTYSLLTGKSATGMQVIGVSVTDTTGASTLINEFETNAVAKDANTPKTDIGVDANGNAYVMYNTPDDNGDFQVTKISTTTGQMWTVKIDGFWLDPNWTVKKNKDLGVQLMVSDKFQSVYVLGTTMGDPALGGPFLRLGIVDFDGHLIANQVIQRMDVVNNNLVPNPGAHGVGKMLMISNETMLAIVGNTTDAGSQGDVSVFLQDPQNGGSLLPSQTFKSNASEYATDALMVNNTFLYIVGNTKQVFIRNGNPYTVDSQTLIRFDSSFDPANAVRMFVDTFFDQFGRPGQFGPSTLVATSAGFYIGASGAYYKQDPRPVIKLMEGSMKQFIGDPGELKTIANDGRDNVLFGGTRIATTANGVMIRPMAAKLSRSTEFGGFTVRFQVAPTASEAPAGNAVVPQAVSIFPVTNGDPIFAETEAQFDGANYTGQAILLKVQDDPDVTSLSVNPATINAGTSTKLTVTLNRKAPVGGYTFHLKSNSEAAISSRDLTVPAGKDIAVFNVGSKLINFTANVTLSAGPLYLVSTNVTVNPFTVTLTPSPSSVYGTESFDLFVSTSISAPTGGFDIDLKSDNALISVPATVHIDERESFTKITLSTASTQKTTAVTISGGPNFAATTTVTVKALDVVLTTNRASVVGGNAFTLTASINLPAPAGGYQVDLKSDNPFLITVPSFVLVPEGLKSVSVKLKTKVVSSRRDVTIFGGPDLAASVNIAVLPQVTASLTLSAPKILGGDSVIAHVTLSGPAPSNGAKITFSSTIPEIIVPELPVVIPAGGTSADVEIKTVGVANDVSGFVAATWNSTARAPLTVLATQVTSLTTAADVLGGSQFSASVTLNKPAPVGGLTVNVVSDRSAVPSVTITVPEGVQTYTFSMGTIPVDSDTVATLVAKTTNAQSTSTTTVRAPSVISVALDTNTIVSGGKAIMTIKLNGAAPAGGITVVLSSSNSAATLPPSVVVGGGLKVVKVAVKGSTVTSSTQSTLTATLGGSSKSTVITVNPS